MTNTMGLEYPQHGSVPYPHKTVQVLHVLGTLKGPPVGKRSYMFLLGVLGEYKGDPARDFLDRILSRIAHEPNR